ncbi:MAG: ATP-binding protein [Kofleriaceae bacterium]
MEVLKHAERERDGTPEEVERLRSENAAMRRRLLDFEQQHTDLIHQRAALKTVLASIPYSVFWKDRESIYRGCNQQFAQRAGVASPEQIVGKTDYDLPWLEEAEIYRAGDRRVLSGDKGFENVEETMLTADGQSTVILVSKGPLRDEADDIIGTIGTFTDITARKQMELDLQLAKEKAEAADRAKGDFLATVSHELRTPLALILGPLEQLAARPELSEAAQQDVHRVLRNAWRLKNLVDDILEFTKGEARMRSPRSETLDLGALASALVDEAQGAAAVKHLTLTWVADPLPPVALDPHMFERVLLNLLGNAIKFTPDHGKIEVALRDRGATLELTVRDSGIGISFEDQQTLFRRFQQVDASSTRGYEGTGLGLALVKQFAELMGGSVAVHSEPGHGAEFVVVLPKTLGEGTSNTALLDDQRAARMVRLAPSGEPQAPAEVPLDDGRPMVALVEDHADLRAYAAEVLGTRYRVMTYPNGAAALVGLRLHRPDVVVSDVMMPLLDGHELVAAMKADLELRDLPIILLTAQAGREVLVESLERGADDFLNKPFSAPELLARVAVAVRLRAAYRELCQRNKELVSTQDMLIEAEKLSALGRLLSQLSHEINNPMTVILGNLPPAVQHLEALQEMLTSYRAAASGEAAARLRQRSAELDLDFVLKDFPELLQAIEEAALRVQLIQRDLRSFLRGEAVERSLGDLNEGLRVTIDMLRRGLPCDVIFNVDYGALPPLEFNSGQLKQVFLNVLQNAVDAVSPSGTIEIATSADAERLTVVVADDGPGIPAPERRKIFEPFFTTKEVGKGSGIGLAVCRQILTNHGGSIRLDESAPRGARFVIELPRAEQR